MDQRSRQQDRGSKDLVYATAVDTVKGYGMVRTGDTVVVGVSGGVDSMCLLDLMWRMGRQEKLTLVVVHVHHGLRGMEADRDALLVEEQASRYGLAYEGTRVPPDSLRGEGNLQSRARNLRQACFEEVAARWSAQRIATGHHRDDHVETLIMQLFRGTGSFQGILPVRGERYIRPLIHLGREELVQYAEARDIRYREDASNRESTYLRNRIRRELVPWVRGRVNPSFDRALIRFSMILREEADFLDRAAREAFDRATPRRGPVAEAVALRRTVLERMDPALRRRVIRMAYARIQGSTSGLPWERVDEVCRSLDSCGVTRHRRFPLHGGVHLFVEHREVLVSRQDLWTCIPYRYRLVVGQCLPVPEAHGRIESRMVPSGCSDAGERRDRNAVLLAWPSGRGDLVIRSPRPGDRFRPEGLGGEKKLKEYFMDRKIPRSRRCRLPILEIGGEIAWVVGERSDERFRPEAGVPACLEVRWADQEGEDAHRFRFGSKPL